MLNYELAKKLKEAKGENNNRWKGDSAGYQSKHQYLVRNYGNPIKCDFCRILGKKEKDGRWSIHYALIIGFEHSHNRNHYYSLCRKCHGKYDMDNKKHQRLINMAKSQKGNTSKNKSIIAKNRTRDKYCKRNIYLLPFIFCLQCKKYFKLYHSTQSKR
ncbi:MAG: hypothetical protein AABY22_31360 [Nanoarchaeota archaeon]